MGGVKKINTKKKFVADGVFQAELNEFLQKTLGMDGYAGIEIRATSVNTEIRVRAKAQKYTQGYQVSTGQPKYDFIDIAVRNVELRQGVLGLKVKIMQGTKIRLPNGKDKVMPDYIEITEPKDDRDEQKDPYVIPTK